MVNAEPSSQGSSTDSLGKDRPPPNVVISETNLRLYGTIVTSGHIGHIHAFIHPSVSAVRAVSAVILFRHRFTIQSLSVAVQVMRGGYLHIGR
jgi:hypothetical protein